MKNSFTRKLALITGASRGLGLALARELARSGWSLVIDARGKKELEQVESKLAHSARVRAVPGNIADASHRETLLELAREEGGIDLLVNNASTLGPSPLPELLDYPLDSLEEVFRVNVVAPLALIQAAAPLLTSGAVVINITSDAAVNAYPGWGGYGASKAALEQLSAVLAEERPRWRVYWVDPGDMRTQMQQDAFPGEDISDRPLPEASIPGLMALVEGNAPSGRYLARSSEAERA